MVANILISLSIVVFILSLLDMFLSEQQKKWVSDRTIGLWDWLADARKVSFFDWLRRPSVLRSLTTFAVGSWALYQIALTAYVSYTGEPILGQVFIEYDDVVAIISTLLGSIIGVWVGRVVLRRVLRFQSHMHITMAIAGVTLAIILPILGVTGTYILFPVPIDNPIVGELWHGMIYFIVGFFQTLLLFWLFAVVPVLIMYITTAAVVVTEFTARRVAEYPNGPVLAISALVGAIAALLKGFKD